MFRRTFVAIVLLVATVASTSVMKKALVRRQNDAQPCQAIQGFDCKCTYYRVTCATEQDLPAKLTVLSDEQHKYQSVELVISAARDISANAETFEPVKQLYKPDGDNLEFRVKFEKFTALHLTSPGIFNRVFPQNLPANARKHIALEIYNPEVQPHDNVNLFQNLNVDSLELYALYPFRGSFQQLFNGANINYLRLSGGEIRSDASQSFTGNVGRLELAKQATALSVQNFPVYPAHELIINAFYLSEFDNPHPPNYNNLGELRVHTQGAIPANAFRNFPNLHTLSLSAEQGIDPQALNGLNNLEKLTIKDGKVNPEMVNALPKLKELEASVEKLDEKTQCQLLEKLANGQLAVQAIPNGRECTCVSAYLDTAAGRAPCDAQHCDHSPCAAIKNNYDPNTRTFKAPPAIQRADGSNALQQRPPRVYQTPFQISRQDQEKLQQGAPQQVQQPVQDNQGQNPSQGQGQGQEQNQDQNQDQDTEQGTGGENQETADENQATGDGTSAAGASDAADTKQPGPDAPLDDAYYPTDDEIEGSSGNGTETSAPGKKRGMSWLPIIIIAAAIAGLLLIGLIVLLLRKKRASNKGDYNRAATNDPHTAGRPS